MKCERKPRFVDAIRWDGVNTERVKKFAPNITHISIIPDREDSLFIMNEYNHCYSAKIGDYIVYDGEHTYTMSKEPFEQEYIIYEN